MLAISVKRPKSRPKRNSRLARRTRKAKIVLQRTRARKRRTRKAANSVINRKRVKLQPKKRDKTRVRAKKAGTTRKRLPQTRPVLVPPKRNFTWVPPTSDQLIVVSVTSTSNLHRAKVMARSVKAFEPAAKILICLVEETMHPQANSPHVDQWVLAKDLNIPNFHRNMFKYNINEGTTSMKAAAIKYAMQVYPEASLFLYLDTDMRVYYPLTDIKELMKQQPIWLTPHVLTIARHADSYLHHGIFNSGILGLTRSEQASLFLDWWDYKLYESCYFDDKLFVDQGWLDFAPLYFDAKTLRHPGYNMAAWNIGELGRDITHTDGGYYYIYEFPLVIFHYSGIHWGLLQKNLQDIYPDGRNLLYKMLDEYFVELEEMGKQEVSSVPWSYDMFYSGEPIRPESRWAYRDNPEAFANVANPFLLSNASFNPYLQQPQQA